MKPIKIIKNKPKRRTLPVDSKKENIIKELGGLLETRGFLVRREHLKQGIGFKVMSGTCRANDRRLILLDRRLPQNEQISFLVGRLITQESIPSSEEVSALSQETRALFEGSSAPAISCVS